MIARDRIFGTLRQGMSYAMLAGVIAAYDYDLANA
jgi:hypothetical protein